MTKEDGAVRDERAVLNRKQTLAACTTLLFSSFLLPSEPAMAEEKVCDKILGCEQPKTLAPPKRVYKDIFEEERELARQRDEAAEKERREKQQAEFKALHGQFAAIQKGTNDFERDIKELLSKIRSGSGDDQSWDDIRRIARLYDTALRKDGMDPIMGRVKKMKLEFDRKAGDEYSKKLNSALKNMDKAGKKRDGDVISSSFQEAQEALKGWLALEPKTV
jgi:septal ring factor EnvC (AmiA/AmiB activator)